MTPELFQNVIVPLLIFIAGWAVRHYFPNVQLPSAGGSPAPAVPAGPAASSHPLLDILSQVVKLDPGLQEILVKLITQQKASPPSA